MDFDFQVGAPEYAPRPCATCGGRVPTTAPDHRCRWHDPQPHEEEAMELEGASNDDADVAPDDASNVSPYGEV